MNAERALLAYQLSLEARRQAHWARRSKLPGWRIYYRAAMQRALTKWQQYAAYRRTVQ